MQNKDSITNQAAEVIESGEQAVQMGSTISEADSASTQQINY